MSKDKSVNFRCEEVEWEAFKASLPPDTTAPRMMRKLMRAYTKHTKFTVPFDPVVEGAVQEVVAEVLRSR